MWDAIVPPTRTYAVSTETKVIATLRFLITWKIQLCNSDDLGLSQPIISVCICVSFLLIFIKPSTEKWCRF